MARSHRPSTRLAEPTQRLAEPTPRAAEPAHGTTQASQPVVQPQVSQQQVPQTQVAQTQQPTQIPPQESAGVPTSGHSAPATPRQPTPSSRASGELRIETPIETPRPGVVDQGVIESPWAAPVQDTAVPRLVFVRHRQERERSRRIKMSVELEWAGRVLSGSASTVDVPKARLEATVEATLRAVEAAVEGSGGRISFEVEGTEIINALDHSYALVSVHSISSGRFAPLTGVVGISSDPELAAILATLRATERPVRVLLGGAMRRAAAKDTTSAEPDPTPSAGDPLKLWGRP